MNGSMRRVTEASWIMEPFGEIVANFSLQLSARTQFATICYKKLSQKTNVKNINQCFSLKKELPYNNFGNDCCCHMLKVMGKQF